LYVTHLSTTTAPSTNRLPLQALNRVSDAAKKTLDIVAKFVEEECIP
jgi:hypothetical protein